MICKSHLIRNCYLSKYHCISFLNGIKFVDSRRTISGVSICGSREPATYCKCNDGYAKLSPCIIILLSNCIFSFHWIYIMVYKNALCSYVFLGKRDRFLPPGIPELFQGAFIFVFSLLTGTILCPGTARSL